MFHNGYFGWACTPFYHRCIISNLWGNRTLPPLFVGEKMEEFFNKILDAILEVFTNIFSFVPFQVFFLLGSLLIFIVFFIQSLIARGRKE